MSNPTMQLKVFSDDSVESEDADYPLQHASIHFLSIRVT
jgi:hypothetical protein